MEIMTLYVPDQFVSETRKIDFVYRQRQAFHALNTAIRELVAMGPVPEDYSNAEDYRMACEVVHTRKNALRDMVAEIDATLILAGRVVAEEG